MTVIEAEPLACFARLPATTRPPTPPPRMTTLSFEDNDYQYPVMAVVEGRYYALSGGGFDRIVSFNPD